MFDQNLSLSNIVDYGQHVADYGCTWLVKVATIYIYFIVVDRNTHVDYVDNY